MYTNDPINNPIDALRLEFGDVDECEAWLSDETYQYLINQNLTKPKALRRSIGMSILAYLSRNTRERVGQEERYGSEAFNNYLKWLNLKIKDPSIATAPSIYVGGTDRATVQQYENDLSLIDSVFYKGQQSGKPLSRNKRRYTSTGVIEPDSSNILNRDPNLNTVETPEYTNGYPTQIP